MRASARRGFTLIEMMVALVAAGVLMASLVGLSASVQRTFGYSKDISELQSNLRFAMKTVVEDLGRVSYMHTADPNLDYCHRYGPLPAVNPIAMSFDGAVLDIRGNFVSARDYLLDLTQSRVLCRNQMDAAGTVDGLGGACGGYEPYLQPFADGPDNLGDVFCPGQTIRMEAEQRAFMYLSVTAVNPASFGLTVDTTNISREVLRGHHRWVNPLTLVRYRLAQDGAYTAPFSSPTAAAQRWRLMRQGEGCDNGALVWGNPIELADFLLPPGGALPSGFELQFVEDTNAQLCAPGGAPAPALTPPVLLNAAGQLNPVRARAFVVTLRGRTLGEDPNYTLPGLAGDPTTWMNFGVDLDNSLTNGLAYVRTERTVIQLRNLGLNQAL